MVLEGTATILQAVTGLKKTEDGCRDEGDTKPEFLLPEKTDYGHEIEGGTDLGCPDTEMSNGGCPYSSPTPKKTGTEATGTGEAKSGCPEEEKTDYGLEGEGETNLKCPGVDMGNGGCPYAFPSVIIPSFRPSEYLDAPSSRLKGLLEGADIPGDSGHPPDPPEWLDRDLFNEGRKFYRKYLFCLTFSELLALLLVLAQRHVIKPLIHTGRSDSPSKARRRYLSTLFHLMSWFDGDVWDPSSPSYRDIMSIRTTHRRLGLTFNQSGEYEKVLSVSVGSRGYRPPPDSLLPALKEDLRAAGVKKWRKKKDTEEEEEEEEVMLMEGEYPVIVSHGKEEEEKKKKDYLKEERCQTYTTKEEKKMKKDLNIANQEDEKEEKEKKKEDQDPKTYPRLREGEEEEEEEEKMTKNNNNKNKKKEETDFPLFISQLDMSLTQYSFMGLLVAHPAKLGAGGATRREMESLIHFWRGLGWLLGVEDQFNFCSGTLEETRDLCLEVERDILLPRLSEANWDYEHMVSSLVGGMSQFLHMLSLPAMMRYLTHTLDLPAPALARTFTWLHTFQYWLMRFTFGTIYYTPGFLRSLNTWFLAVIARVTERDKVNLAAYRRAQAALTVPLKDGGVKRGGV